MSSNLNKLEFLSDELKQRFLLVREETENLLSNLSEEDSCVQSMTDASPAKWHAAHTTWFFETFILKQYEKHFTPFDESFESLFNSYYNSIGEQFAHHQRGLITRPTLSRIVMYRKNIDERISNILEKTENPKLLELVELGINHEQQHQELLIMDIKHLFSINPTYPALFDDVVTTVCERENTWVSFEGGLSRFGRSDTTFHFDNETPSHNRYLESFKIASQLVSNREFLEFVDDGGYENPLLWLSDGWSWLNENRVHSPLYWEKKDNSWFEFTLYGLTPLDKENPVCHINFYEASAYALWTGARLPSEFEWEHSANDTKIPVKPIRYQATKSGEKNNLEDLHGAVWQWTNSGYLPYPRFNPPSGAIGEYNGKFMSNQNVLRGSACCTPTHHGRHTYRNFFYPHQRWAFSGLRLAKDNQP